MNRNGALIVALVAAFALMGGVTYWLYSNSVRERTELNATAQSMIYDMASFGWSKESIDRHATPELKEWMDANHLDEGIPDFRSLGPMKKYKGVQDYTFESDDKVRVLAVVEFEGGDAGVSLHLSKVDGEWLISKLNLDASMVRQDGKKE